MSDYKPKPIAVKCDKCGMSFEVYTLSVGEQICPKCVMGQTILVGISPTELTSLRTRLQQAEGDTARATKLLEACIAGRQAIAEQLRQAQAELAAMRDVVEAQDDLLMAYKVSNIGRMQRASSKLGKARTKLAALEGGGGNSHSYDLITHLHRQKAFSERTFGPGVRTAGVTDHIRMELVEILANPTDLTEWIDVVLLALDGAWRAGHAPEQIATALEAKQTQNESRKWPDWRTAAPDKAIEHVREGDGDE